MRSSTKIRRETRKRSGEEESDIFSVFSPRKRNDSLFLSSSLTPEERAVLEKSEAASKRIEDDEIKAIRRENRERSEKGSDFVFGKGLRDWL